MKIKNILLLCTALIPCMCLASDLLIPHKPAEYYKGVWEPSDKTWMKEDWTGDNKPYEELRAKIERVAKSENGIESLYVQYEKEALRQPDNPLAQYAWAYSMYQTDAEFKPAEWGAVAAALEATPSPRTYEFARVRFLIESAHFSTTRPVDDFAALAVRLLRKEPKSVILRYFYALYLGYMATDFKSKRIAPVDAANKAVAIAEQLYQETPDDYWGVILTQNRYFRWIAKPNKADAIAVKKGYEHYLKSFKKPEDLGIGYRSAYQFRIREMVEYLQKTH